MEKSYQDLLKMVEEIEGSTVKSEFTSIDITPIQSLKSRKRRPPFQPLLDMAMDLESGHFRVGAPRVQAKQQPTAAVHQEAHAKERQVMDSAMSQQRDLQSSIAKEEVSMFADRLDQKTEQPQPVAGFDVSATGKGDTMLTRLSIPDQISELEKIIDGLADRVFNAEQLETIKKEVNALKRQSSQEARQKVKKNTKKIEQELARLRDQQLNEAIKILGSI